MGGISKKERHFSQGWQILLTMKLREGVDFTGCQRLFVEYFPMWGSGPDLGGVVSTQFVFQNVQKK
jgi:hypothetical protein